MLLPHPNSLTPKIVSTKLLNLCLCKLGNLFSLEINHIHTWAFLVGDKQLLLLVSCMVPPDPVIIVKPQYNGHNHQIGSQAHKIVQVIYDYGEG
jgi:hypothetical protein